MKAFDCQDNQSTKFVVNEDFEIPKDISETRSQLHVISEQSFIPTLVYHQHRLAWSRVTGTFLASWEGMKIITICYVL